MNLVEKNFKTQNVRTRAFENNCHIICLQEFRTLILSELFRLTSDRKLWSTSRTNFWYRGERNVAFTKFVNRSKFFSQRLIWHDGSEPESSLEIDRIQSAQQARQNRISTCFCHIIYKRIGTLFRIHRMKHSFLWDDFIIRHRMKYSQYLSKCNDEAVDFIAYERFYRNEIVQAKYIIFLDSPVVTSSSIQKHCASENSAHSLSKNSMIALNEHRMKHSQHLEWIRRRKKSISFHSNTSIATRILNHDKMIQFRISNNDFAFTS